jgi:hypothetical protein
MFRSVASGSSLFDRAAPYVAGGGYSRGGASISYRGKTGLFFIFKNKVQQL